MHNYKSLSIKSHAKILIFSAPQVSLNFTDTILISFNIHDNSYCTYIKSCKNAYQHCCSKKNKVRLKSHEGAFCGVCYAGVQEYVYPIKVETETVGIICVSGYQCENASSYLHSVAKKFELDFEKLSKVYATLKTDMPPKNEVDTLILPLCEMLELAYLRLKNTKPIPQSFPEKILQYLKENHTERISSIDVCEHFSCSRSYMSREFNRYTSKTIKEYLAELRIKDAQALLESSGLSITEIAYSVGYGDSNYFSNVFREKVGISPHAYRKKYRK